jgi:hypothetical protein
MDDIKERSQRSQSRHAVATIKRDTVTIIASCDSIIEEYGLYREATEQFVATSDSIMSALYDANKMKEAAIIEHLGYMETVGIKYQILATQSMLDRQKKRKWQRIAAVLGVALGITLIAR